MLRRNGTTGWAFSRAIPLFDAAGEITEWFGTATNVTERHRAEEALRASEERYRPLFDSIDEGFCVIEVLFDAQQQPVDYFFHEVNPAFELQAGMHGATGKRMLEFVSHIEPHWLENYGRGALTGEPIRFAAEYRGLNWFDVYAFRVGAPASRRVAVLFNNITQREQPENALRESEARFRNMADHSPMMLWVTDASGQCTHLNEQWYEFTGQTPQTGLGSGWLDAIHPHDRQQCDRLFHESHSRREAFRLEYRLRRQDGLYRWALDAASPRFSDSGEFLGYIGGSVIDTQERKETEEALRKSRERFDIVKDGAQVGFWFCDLPFDELIWDNRVKEHFWLPPEATVTIELFYDRLHPEDREATRRAIERSIAERTWYDIEYRTVSPETHREKWIRAIGRTFYDDAGRPIRFDGVTLDITERKQSENALREAKEQAEQASRAKDDFLAQLSHELRTPLTPVLMTAAALREDESLAPEIREQLDVIAQRRAGGPADRRPP